MAGKPAFTPVTAPNRGKGKSIKGWVMTILIGLALAVVIVAFTQHQQTVSNTYGKLLAAASPAVAGANKVDLSLGNTPTPTPAATITTTRTQVTVPATGTEDIDLTLKEGDQLVGLYDAPNQVDFSLWDLSVPRQRLLQQVRVRGESNFSWTAKQDGDYVLEFTSPQTTDVSVAYAIRKK